MQGWQFEYQWFALFFELAIFLLIDFLIIFPGPPTPCLTSCSLCCCKYDVSTEHPIAQLSMCLQELVQPMVLKLKLTVIQI